MPRLLMLDDSKERQEWFDEALDKLVRNGFNDILIAVYVETAAEAIQQLRDHEFDILFLDHDLGGKTFVDSRRKDCGMEVVRYLNSNPVNNLTVIIHSWNVPAAMRMEADLKYTDGVRHVVRAGFGSQVFKTITTRVLNSLLTKV